MAFIWIITRSYTNDNHSEDFCSESFIFRPKRNFYDIKLIIAPECSFSPPLAVLKLLRKIQMTFITIYNKQPLRMRGSFWTIVWIAYLLNDVGWKRTRVYQVITLVVISSIWSRCCIKFTSSLLWLCVWWNILVDWWKLWRLYNAW